MRNLQVDDHQNDTHLRVVIVGAGFVGLEATRTLRHAPVRVTMIGQTNHHVFQPLLYQVATAELSPADISAPILVCPHGLSEPASTWRT